MTSHKSKMFGFDRIVSGDIWIDNWKYACVGKFE